MSLRRRVAERVAGVLVDGWPFKAPVQTILDRRVRDLEGRILRHTAELESANAHLQREIQQKTKMEVELRLAQKLEAVGRIAAGVAHELNTPIQFTADSTHFLQESMDELRRALAAYQDFVEATDAPASQREELEQTLQEVDIPYLLENIPRALERCTEGLSRLSSIVRSMKEFAHPDHYEMQPSDLNRAINNTLTVSRNEYKYCAELETSFAELPQVTCHIGEVNQAVLNIVVNAAHAIQDAHKDPSVRGKIRVATYTEGGDAVISIQDNGAGIPAEIHDKIFDQFFTTKEVGRGTGQGLAIAHSVIVEKHKGRLTFESEVGKGTTFFLRLPLSLHSTPSMGVP